MKNYAPVIKSWQQICLKRERALFGLRGVHMESVPAEKQTVAKSPFHAPNILLAVSTTGVVGLELATHWGSYGWFNKAVGVILVLSLLTSLLELISKKERINLQGFVTLAYMWLVLATILFGH
jgi:hypothetical protein